MNIIPITEVAPVYIGQAENREVGTIAADVISEAILKAVTSAQSAYGFPSTSDLDFL